MRKIINILFIIFLLAVPSTRVKAAAAGEPMSIRSDSSNVKPRPFNQSALMQYRAQKNFQYGSDYQTPQSLWARFWKWFWDFFKDRISDASSNIVISYISIILLVGIAIVLVIKFSGLGVLQLFTGKAKTIEMPYHESLEDIHAMNFEQEIEKAITHKDYRLAVRMLYLRCLKKLSDSGVISWQIDKTNSNYIAELRNSDLRKKFVYLTREFEFIWYGEFKLDQSAFLQIHNEFKDFNKGL